jgi:hypothetical protein
MARPGNGGNPNRTSPPPIIRCRGIDGHEGSHGKLTSTLQTMMAPEIPAPSSHRLSRWRAQPAAAVAVVGVLLAAGRRE